MAEKEMSNQPCRGFDKPLLQLFPACGKPPQELYKNRPGWEIFRMSERDAAGGFFAAASRVARQGA
ncbi:MAG: hypothetical protein WCS65_09825 [Verrucomicrobiae bacterium]